MEPPALTPEQVRQSLRLLAGIDISADEAARVAPWVQATREALAAIADFGVDEVRSSLQFDPTGPYRARSTER